MEKEIISQVIRELEKTTVIDTKDKAKFSNPGYEAVEISKDNFSSIEKQNRTLCFVDGGNQEIVQAASFSLQLIRLYYNVFKSNKKARAVKKEFFVLIKAEQESLSFTVDVFGDSFPELKNLKFDSMEKTLRTGNHRIIISKIGDVVRRYAEILCAAHVDLEGDAILILDGDLKADNEREEMLLEKVYTKAGEKGYAVAALSKATSMLTEKGSSFGAILRHIAPPHAWLYHPIANSNSAYHKADMAFVKLSNAAKRIFKLEAHKGGDIKGIAAALAYNAIDPIFLGYPYGLVDADRFARISNNEREIFRTEFMAKLGKKWKDVEGFTALLNAHQVLDNSG